MTDSRAYRERRFDVLLEQLSGVGFAMRPVRGPIVPHAGRLAAGEPVEVCPANPDRVYLIVQNPGTGNLWVRFGADATEGGESLWLGGGANIGMENAFVCPDAISLYSDADDAPYLIWEGSYAAQS